MSAEQAAPDNALSPLRALERVANRLLARDPETLDGLSRLAGKVIRVELLNTRHPAIDVLPGEHGIRLETDCPRAADTLIRATPVELLIYAGFARRRVAGVSHNMEIRGDPGLAQALQRALQDLDLDWEALLAGWTGGTLARKSNRLFNSGVDLLRNLRDKVVADLGEYSIYEKELLPDQDEVEEFNGAVEVLRDDVARLQKRLDRLSANGS